MGSSGDLQQKCFLWLQFSKIYSHIIQIYSATALTSPFLWCKNTFLWKVTGKKTFLSPFSLKTAINSTTYTLKVWYASILLFYVSLHVVSRMMHWELFFFTTNSQLKPYEYFPDKYNSYKEKQQTYSAHLHTYEHIW